MYLKRENIEPMISNKSKKYQSSLFTNYQENVSGKMKGGDFVFDYIDRLYHCCHKITVNHGGSYQDSLKWLKNKKSIIHPKNEDHKYFQYAVTAGLNHEKIRNHPVRISNIEKYYENYNWRTIKFPAERKDWKDLKKILRCCSRSFVNEKK